MPREAIKLLRYSMEHSDDESGAVLVVSSRVAAAAQLLRVSPQCLSVSAAFIADCAAARCR